MSEPDGAPLVGARVEAELLSSDSSATVIGATTGRDGRFKLLVSYGRQYVVRAGCAGHAERTLVVDAPNSEVHLVLPKVTVIDGRVVDSAGRAQAATVYAREFVRDSGEILEKATSADESGAFVLQGLQPGHVTLIARGTSPGDAEIGTAEVTLVPEARVQVTVALRPSYSLSGYVVEQDGGFVDGARVECFTESGTRRVISADGGGFVFRELDKGPVKLVAQYGERESATHDVREFGASPATLVLPAPTYLIGRVVTQNGSPVSEFVVDGEPFDGGDGRFRVEVAKPNGVARLRVESTERILDYSDAGVVGQVVDVGDVVLERTRIAELHIVSTNGSDVPDARVLVLEGAPVTSATADIHGLAQLAVEDTTTVLVSHRDFVPQKVLVAAGASHLTVQLQSGATVHVRVRDSNGAASVATVGGRSDIYPDKPPRSTDDDGSLVISGLGVGKWQFWAVGIDGFGVSAVLEIPSGANRVVDVNLRKGNGAFEVDVVDGPEPLRFINVVASELGPPQTLSDLKQLEYFHVVVAPLGGGRFKVSRISPGHYYVVVFLKDHFYSKAITFRGGANEVFPVAAPLPGELR